MISPTFARYACVPSARRGEAAAGSCPHGDQREAASWFDRFLAQETGDVPPLVLGRALAARADIAFDLQDYDTLMHCGQRSLSPRRIASQMDRPLLT